MKKLRFAKQIGYNKENMNMEEEKGAEALSLQNGNKTESPYKSKTLTDIYGKTVAGLEKLRQRTGANRDPQKDGVAVTDKFKETLRESVAKYTGRTPQEHWNEAENALLGGLTQLRKRYEAEYLLREKTANYSDYLARMQEAADDPEIMKATIAWGKNRVDPGVKAAAEAAAAEATDAQLDALLKSARTDTEQAAFQAEIARRKAAGAGTAAAAQEAIKPETALYDLLSAEDRADMLSLREIGYAPDAETIKAKLQNEMEAIDLRIGYDMLDGQALQDAEARKQQIAEGLQAFDAQSAAAQEREAAIAAEEESEAVKAYKALQESGADIFFSQRYQQEQQQKAADWDAAAKGTYQGTDETIKAASDKYNALWQEWARLDNEMMTGVRWDGLTQYTAQEMAEMRQRSNEILAQMDAIQAQAQEEMKTANDALKAMNTAEHGEGSVWRLLGALGKDALTELNQGIVTAAGFVAKPIELLGQGAYNLITGKNESFGDTIKKVQNGKGLWSSLEQSYKDQAQKAQEEAYHARKALGGGEALDIGYDVAKNMLEMVPDVLMNLASGGGKTAADVAVYTQNLMTGYMESLGKGTLQKLAGEMATNPAYYTSLIREWGSDIEELREAGVPVGLDAALGTFTALINAGIEIGGGGVQEIGKQGAEDGWATALFKRTGKEPNAVMRVILGALDASPSEALEEVMQGGISGANTVIGRAAAGKETPLMSMTPGEKAMINVPDIAKEALLGGLAGGAMGGGASIISNAKAGIDSKRSQIKADKAAGNAIKPDTKETLQKLAATIAGKPAELAGKYDPAKASAKQTGELFRETIKGLSGQYRETLVDRLSRDFNEAGISDDASHAIVQMMAGMELSEGQIQALARDARAMDALYEAMGMKEPAAQAAGTAKATARTEAATRPQNVLELEPMPGMEENAEETEETPLGVPDAARDALNAGQAENAQASEETRQTAPEGPEKPLFENAKTQPKGEATQEKPLGVPDAARDALNAGQAGNAQASEETRQTAPEGQEKPLFENAKTQPKGEATQEKPLGVPDAARDALKGMKQKAKDLAMKWSAKRFGDMELADVLGGMNKTAQNMVIKWMQDNGWINGRQYNDTEKEREARIKFAEWAKKWYDAGKEGISFTQVPFSEEDILNPEFLAMEFYQQGKGYVAAKGKQQKVKGEKENGKPVDKGAGEAAGDFEFGDFGTGTEQLKEEAPADVLQEQGGERGEGVPERDHVRHEAGEVTKEAGTPEQEQARETAETGNASEKPTGLTHGRVMEILTDDNSGAVEARMEDGSTVPLEDAGLSDEQKQIALGAADLPQEAQAAMAGAYTPGQKVSDYINGFRTLYKNVAKGKSAAKVIESSVYAQQLTPEQKKAAIAAGKIAYAKEQAAAAHDTRKTLAKLKKQGAEFQYLSDPNDRSAGVFFARVRNGISRAAKAQLMLLDKLAKKMGFQVRVYDHMSENGSYKTGSNIINLALDAEGGLLNRTASHELFHFIKEWNKEAGQRLQDFILNTLKSKEGYDFEKRRQKIIDQYSTEEEDGGIELEGEEAKKQEKKKEKKPFTPEEAEEEMAAEGMLDAISTEEGLQKLFKETDDRTMLEKIRDWIADTVQKIRQTLNELAWNHPEVRALKDDADYLQRVQEMFTEALRQAGENYRMSQRGLYDSAKADPDVQAYLEAVKGAITPEAAREEADALASRLFARTEKGWIAQHMDEYEQGFEKFKEAMKAFGSGSVGIAKAFQDQGLDVPEKALFPVLGYAGRQVESAETQAEAETLQSENDNGSIKHKYSHRSFSEQVDDLKKGNIPSGDSLFVCATPKVFQDIGFSYLPMTIDQYHANAAIKGTKPNHFIPEKIFKTLPEQLQKPVAIIESESRTEDSVIVVLDKELKTGQWMAAIEIEGTRHLNGQEYKVVPINNTQGRKNTISKLLRNALKNEIENGHGVYYINEKRARQLTEDEGVQFPDNIPPNGLMHSIAKPNESVNKKSSFRASAQDAEYMRAVEEDDEFTQEEMVIEAAKKAGYNYVRYTRRKLNPRNNGADYYMFVEADKEGKVAQVYGDNRYFATDRTAVDINDIEDEIKEAWREFAEENDYPENSLELTDEGFPDDIVDSAGIFDNQDFMAYLYEHALLDRFGDETPVIRTADGLVVFGDDYGIIKSGDPITYDDNGDIIPLSERFQEGNPDIRYSRRASTDETQTQEALEEVTDDPELYSQMAADADIRAAWQLLMRLHRLTTQGGENALIRKGAFEQRLSDIIQKIADKTGTKYGPIKLRNALRKIYQAMENSQYSPGEILQYARDLMKDVLDASPGVLVEQDETTKEILAGLKRRRFYLTDDQKSEIQHTFGTISRFRQKNFGTLNIAKRDAKTASLEDVWREDLAPMLPSVFSEDTSPLDMPAILDAWMETTREKKYAGEFGHNIGAYATDLALNAMLDFYDVPGALKTKSEIRAGFQERFDAQQAEIKRLKETARGAVDQARLQYEERYRQRVEKAQERRLETEKKKKLRGQITRDVRAINSLNVRNSDTSHVPQAMQAAALKAVEPFLSGSGVFSGAEMMRLAREYKLLEERKGEIGGFDEDILTTIEGLPDKLNGRRLSQLTEAELQDLADTMGNLRKIIAEENEAFLNGRKTTVDALSGRLKSDMREKGPAKQGPIAKAARAFRYLEETPAYFADRVGGVIKDMIGDFYNGETTWADVIDGAIKYKDEMLKKYRVADWINDKKHARFVTQNGDQIELNKQEALTLYAQWKREHMNKLQNACHLRVGGFMYGKGAKYEGVDTLRPHPLTDSDMQMIKSYLTEEEMAFADEMVKYLSEDMAKLGNEVSMALYGYEKFTEPYYFPYNTDKRFLASDLTQTGTEQVKQPKSKGFTKALTQNAATPLTVGNFMDMWASHVNEMALYKGFAEAVDTMSRVFNQRIPGEIRTDSATGAEFATPAESNWVEMERALGEEGVRYLRTLVRDISGGVRADERGFAAKGLSLFKKGAVLGNASVVLQQPTAYARAMDMISPIYLNLVSKETAHLAKNIREMNEYSGVAKIKKMGRFDTGTGKGAIELLTEGTEDRNVAQKVLAGIDTVAGIGAEKADEWTWGLLWGAVKKETENTHPELTPGSEAFLKATAERFNDICRHTQVYDSVMSKSTWMRSNSIMDKTMTSFMAEPTLSLNMLLGAMQKFNQPGGKKKIARAAATFVLNSLLVALAKSIMTATRRKNDEGRTWLEKYLAESAGNFVEDISPFGLASMIPWARDAVSMLEGYDVKRSDMDAVEQLTKGYKALKKYIEGGDVSLEDTLRDTLGPVANMFGVPLKNLWRDTEAIAMNLFGGASAGEPTTGRDLKYSVLENLNMGPISLWGDGNKAYYDRMEQALLAGDTAKYEELRGYLEETKQVKPNTITTGVKNEIKDSMTRGLISDDKAMTLLQEQFGMDKEKAWSQTEKWRQEAAHEDDEEYSYTKYGEVMDLVKENKDITAAVKKLTTNAGMTEKEVRGAVKSGIGEWYRKGEITKAQAEGWLKKYAKITDADDLYWIMDEWDYKKAHPKADYKKYDRYYSAIEKGAGLTEETNRYLQHGVKKDTLAGAITSQYKPQYLALLQAGKTSAAANLKNRLLRAYEVLGYSRAKKSKDIDAWLKQAQKQQEQQK